MLSYVILKLGMVLGFILRLSLWSESSLPVPPPFISIFAVPIDGISVTVICSIIPPSINVPAPSYKFMGHSGAGHVHRNDLR